ncbi:hypothetical protein ACJRO7_026658 [Eucalyptus globulus]|uniref:Uncharacterized protein n=1 Tax=Eucalyptus globulus TaxID=34317 RepID=A0ABD3JTN2_EUCGL
MKSYGPGKHTYLLSKCGSGHLERVHRGRSDKGNRYYRIESNHDPRDNPTKVRRQSSQVKGAEIEGKKKRRKNRTEIKRDEFRTNLTPITKFNWRRDDLMTWWLGRHELDMTTQRLSRQRAQPRYSIDSNGQQRDRITDGVLRSFHRTLPEQYPYVHSTRGRLPGLDLESEAEELSR